MVVVNSFGLDPNMQDQINQHMEVDTHYDDAFHEAPPEARASTDVAIIFVFSEVTPSTCDADLDAVISLGAGLDHIDLSYCEDQGITVCNTPHYGSDTVAEHTFALLLRYERHLPAIEDKSPSFERHNYLCEQLSGKTFGAYGTGGIGRAASRIAHGFNMDVIGYDPEPRGDLQDQDWFAYVDQDELFSTVDYLGLYAPAVPATANVVDKESLAAMDDQAVLINTARSHLVDHKALLDALDQDELRGALLDVVADDYEDAFSNHDHAVVTPHHAFYTREALRAMARQASEAVEAIKSGGRPEHMVTNHI